MNQKFKRIVLQYMKNLSAEEIYRFSSGNGIELSTSEAREIANYFQNTKLDPFDAYDREIFFQDLATMTNQNLANKAEETLYTIIHAYGLEHLL